MDKYDGMKKVEASVRENREVVKKERKKSLPRFFWQLALAGVCAAVLFTCRLFSPAQSALAKVKEAVCFDATAYVQALIEDTD